MFVCLNNWSPAHGTVRGWGTLRRRRKSVDFLLTGGKSVTSGVSLCFMAYTSLTSILCFLHGGNRTRQPFVSSTKSSLPWWTASLCNTSQSKFFTLQVTFVREFCHNRQGNWETWPHSELKSSLDYIQPCLGKRRKEKMNRAVGWL